MTYRLNWDSLLAKVRVRELLGFEPYKGVQGDSRSEFERDYGRTVYSTPFRRLRDKAQVFPLEPNDSVRTRLLHSMEVSSVAEDLAAQAVKDTIPDNKLIDDQLRAIPLIAATCGLVHDIGNPPFGHAGEQAIATWCHNKFESDPDFFKAIGAQDSQLVQDFFNFEGNAHATRLLSNIEHLVHPHGLNFTAATMSAAGKYLAASNEVKTRDWHEFSKPGYFSSETSIVRAVRQATGTVDCRHPLTFLVEAADDIVFCSVDIEDAIRRGVLHWETVESMLNKEGGELAELVVKDAERHAKPLRDEGRAYHSALAQTFRVAAISHLVVSARQRFRQRYAEIMNGEYHKELLLDDESDAAGLINTCKKILRLHVYRHRDILSLEVRGRRVIHDLMEFFWEAVKGYHNERKGPPSARNYEDKLFLLMSDNYRRGFERAMNKGDQNELYLKLQLIVDQVAGMTDTYACDLHRRLTNGV